MSRTETRRRRVARVVAVVLGALALLWFGAVAAFVGYHDVHESAFDSCTLTPPWRDLPDGVDWDLEWRWSTLGYVCVYHLHDGRTVERDWDDPPWDELPPKWAARILSESSRSGEARVTCRPSDVMDYACRYADDSVEVLVDVDRTSITRQRASP